MNYKIQGALKRNKKYFIIFGILWIFLAIVFVAPVAYSKFMASRKYKIFGSIYNNIWNFYNTSIPNL